MAKKKTTKRANGKPNAFRVESWFDGMAMVREGGAMRFVEKPPGWVSRGTYVEKAHAERRKRQIMKEEHTTAQIVPLRLKARQYSQLPGVRPYVPKPKRARDTLKKGAYLLQERSGGKWVDRDVETSRAAALRRRDANQRDGYLFRVVDHAGHVIEPASDREFAADE